MKTMQAAWGFYGRQREISQLRKRVDAGRFHMVAVIGGRGVGKTQLIKETLRSMDGWPPPVLPGWASICTPKVRTDQAVS